MFKRFFTLILLLITAIVTSAQDTPEEVIIHIAPYLQPCVGVGPQDCMIVRFDDEDDLSFFYDSIEGFTFEEGFEYTLSVSISEVENPPADASSLQYELIEIVQQLPAQPQGKVWELQSLNGEDLEESSRYSFIITEEEGMSIQADCNNVLANISLSPFSIETTITTLAMCPEDSLESDYVAALNAATMMTVENGELILQSSEGQLRFAPPAITETEWVMTGYVSPSDMIDFEDSADYTLQIIDDRATMQIACNDAGSLVESNGAVLHFTELETTEADCEYNPLGLIYPPERVVYSVAESGNLILEDAEGRLFEFVANS